MPAEMMAIALVPRVKKDPKQWPSKKDCIRICKGDRAAGFLLAQIIWYYMPHPKTGKLKKGGVMKEGFWWIVNTYEQWAWESDISLEQFKLRFRLLKEGGFIHSHVWRFYGTPTTHLRIDHEKVMAAWDALTPILSPKQKSQAKRLSKKQTVSAPLMSLVPEPPIRLVSETPVILTEITNREDYREDSVLEDQNAHGVGGEDPGTGGTEGETRSGSEANFSEILEPVNSEVSMNAAEIQAKFQQSRQNLPVSGPLPELWRRTVQREYGGEQLALTQREIGGLNQVRKRVNDDDKTRAALVYAVSHWSKFASHACINSGKNWEPSEPDVPFFQAHIETAINMCRDATSKPTPAPAPPPVQPVAFHTLLKPTTPAVTTPSFVGWSFEEIIKWDEDRQTAEAATHESPHTE